MRETRQVARQRRRRRGLIVGAATGLVVTGLVAGLVMTMQPDRKEEAGRVSATSVAEAEAEAEVALPTTSPGEDAVGASAAAAVTTIPSAGARTPAASVAPSAGSATSTASASAPAGAKAPAAAVTTPAADAPRTVSAAASLAGRIRPQETYEGVATHYDAADGNGACSFGPSSDMMIAAMNTADYETSKACGAYVLVRTASGASVTVRIVNECPGDCAPGQLDLSEQAFAKLAPLVTGRLSITWSLVSPATAGTISIRYKEGSSEYWCGIQAIGHRNPLARLEVQVGGSWRRLERTEYNYFLAEDGSGCGGAIRLTDIYGEQLTVNGLAVRPDAVQSTQLQFARH